MTYDLVSGEVVITATEFKAKCLDLLDRVNSGEIRKVHITKRGKEVGQLVMPKSDLAEPWNPHSIFGCMTDETVLPDDLDIDGPIYDPEVHGIVDPLRGLTNGT
jgi:prevent-host-death family protein